LVFICITYITGQIIIIGYGFFNINAYRPERAVITAGGVNVKEINPKTMESRLLKGLFFAGEVMDVDGFTGGFNLQIAFSTGRAAGLWAANSC